MRIEFETHSDGEITFIMEVIYDKNDEIRRMECIGWYVGEEDDELTEHYKYTGSIAVFD